MKHIVGTLAVLATTLIPSVAPAETFPARPIKMVVPFPPGGGVDTLARTVAKPLGDILGQQVIFANKSGASRIIGSESWSRA